MQTRSTPLKRIRVRFCIILACPWNGDTCESDLYLPRRFPSKIQRLARKYSSLFNFCSYSLLGSSGCGKTTLLSCVVGLKELDSGTIRVFGSEPGTKGSGIPGRRVGYMPQEIALYGEFSIAEVLQYFGRLYGMPKSEVDENTTFLVTFLNLPPKSRRINSLRYVRHA